MPSAETDKFIRTCETLVKFAPEQPLDAVFEKAKELMGITGRMRKSRARKPAQTDNGLVALGTK